MAHNTAYHQSVKCTPTNVPLRRHPCNELGSKFSNPLQFDCKKVNSRTLIDGVNQKYRDSTKINFEGFHNYKDYNDWKASAQPFIEKDVAFLFAPTAPQITNSGKTKHSLRRSPETVSGK